MYTYFVSYYLVVCGGMNDWESHIDNKEVILDKLISKYGWKKVQEDISKQEGMTVKLINWKLVKIDKTV